MLEYVSKTPFIVLGFVAVYAGQDQLATTMYARTMFAVFALEMFSELFFVAAILIVALMAFLTSKETDAGSALKKYASNLVLLAIGGCAAVLAIVTGLPQHPTMNLISGGVTYVLSTTVVWGGALGLGLWLLMQGRPATGTGEKTAKTRTRTRARPKKGTKERTKK